MPAIAFDPYLLAQLLRAEVTQQDVEPMVASAADAQPGWLQLLTRSRVRNMQEGLQGCIRDFVEIEAARTGGLLYTDQKLLNKAVASERFRADFNQYLDQVLTYLPLAEASARQPAAETIPQRKSPEAERAYLTMQERFATMDATLRAELAEASPAFDQRALYLFEAMLQRRTCQLAQKMLAPGAEQETLRAGFLQADAAKVIKS